MPILGNIFKRNKQKNTDVEERSIYGGFQSLMFGGSGSFNTNKAMLLSAVYRCVNVISDSIAQLPIDIYKVDSKGYKMKDTQNNLYGILNATPNVRMTRYTFISLIIQSMLLNGNAFVYILRNKNGEVEQLIFVPSNYVSIIQPKTIIDPVSYQVTGINGIVQPKDLLHFVNYTYDGIIGISTISFAKNTLGLSHDSEKHAANFFSSGCGIGGILKSATSLNEKQKEQIKSSWQQAFSSRGGETNGVAVLEGNLDFTPMSVNPADAQLLETRQFNVIDICRFFGVSPIKVFDLSKSSYSTIEASNISFLTDTISPILQKLELEFERKLFNNDNVDVKFDVSQLLRTDKQSLASYYNTLFNIGAISVNEIRREIDLPKIKGGDNNFVQVNLQTLSAATTTQTEPIQEQPTAEPTQGEENNENEIK